MGPNGYLVITATVVIGLAVLVVFFIALRIFGVL
jgi:hypothetical protein